jgi:hypothetical protein
MDKLDIHDGKLQVRVPITLADLKLLKNMTTLASSKKTFHSTNKLNKLFFVVQQNVWYAWTTDSYVLGITEFCRAGREQSIMVQYKKNDPKFFNAYVDRVYASVDVEDFNTDVADINKHYKKEQLDGHMYLRLEGHTQILQPRVITDEITGAKYPMPDGKEITTDWVSIEIDNAGVFTMLNKVDGIEGARDIFRNFWSDARGSLGPDKRRPITHIQYSPTHLKKVMTFLTFNKDDHFTYMYNYDGNFADAVLFQKTCSGTDNATNKYAWIMPQRSELEEE